MRLIVSTLILASIHNGITDGDGDPLDQLRNTIPGEPGLDYPILASIENNEFDCQGKVFGGFYADPDTDCQGYHVCLQVGR